MKKYDIIIIGCGISCLYFLKKIKESNLKLKIGILEKKPFPGGRISSVKIGDDTIDTGALRFTKSHKLLWNLLRRYDIYDIEKLVSDIDIKIDKNLMLRFKTFVKECSRKKYNKFAFGEIAKSVFNEIEYEQLRLWFGYNQKWDNSNCYSLAKNLFNDYDAKQYYHVKNGLSQLVNAMYNDLKDNFDFHFGEKVKKIAEGNNIYTTDKHYTGDCIIFACPPNYIKHISGTEEMIPILSAVEGQILNRIYAKFKDGNWFPKKVLHNYTPVSQTIPINDKIIMISYSTGEDAKYWIQKDMDGKLVEGINEELGIKEKPIWIKQNYWNPGTHYYKPGFIPEEIQDISYKPLRNREWHIIGEAYSMNQGWMEGALQNAELFFKKFINKKLEPELKKYSLSEVKKHNKLNDAWIALFGNVYNITKWIPIHPGGEVIKYGIGKDATEMFKGVGHREDALSFMEFYRIGKLKID